MAGISLHGFKHSVNHFFQTLVTKASGGYPGLATDGASAPAAALHSQHDTVFCKCGWKGKGSDSVKRYHQITDDAVEVELYCSSCKKYLGFVSYRNAD